MRRGEIWWAWLGIPKGSEPGFRRPVVVIQNDDFNASRIGTVIVAAVTTNLQRADSPGNVRIGVRESGLPRASVINVSQILTVDKNVLDELVGSLNSRTMRLVDEGLRMAINL